MPRPLVSEPAGSGAITPFGRRACSSSLLPSAALSQDVRALQSPSLQAPSSRLVNCPAGSLHSGSSRGPGFVEIGKGYLSPRMDRRVPQYDLMTVQDLKLELKRRRLDSLFCFSR